MKQKILVGKELVFVKSEKDYRAFPDAVKQDAGYQLHRIQMGKNPLDAKPMTRIGPGVMELRIWDTSGTYRVIYVAKFPEAVYVLHAFKKTTKVTSDEDIDLAIERYKSIHK